jgi:hypothetical protein
MLPLAPAVERLESVRRHGEVGQGRPLESARPVIRVAFTQGTRGDPLIPVPAEVQPAARVGQIGR